MEPFYIVVEGNDETKLDPSDIANNIVDYGFHDSEGKAKDECRSDDLQSVDTMIFKVTVERVPYPADEKMRDVAEDQQAAYERDHDV